MTEGFETSLEIKDGVPVVSVAGEVDIATAPELSACLDEVDSATALLVVDLSAVTLLDSTGLSVLLRANERVAANGGAIRLVVSSAHLLRIFQIVALDQVFPIFSTLEDAMAT